MVESDHEWTGEQARRERVPRRKAVLSKQERGEVEGTLYSIETGEAIAEGTLEELRRFKRDRDVVLFVNDDLDDETQEVVEQAFRYLVERMEDAPEAGVEATLERPSELRSVNR